MRPSVEKRGPLKHYSPSKKNIYERFAVLQGMQFTLWESEKAFGRGKAPVENVSLNYRTQIEPLGKKMGKPFCIHVLTNGQNEAFWAKNSADQDAWIEALRLACKKPEEPKEQHIFIQQPVAQESKQDIQIQVQIPQMQDPNFLYQQQLMQQQQLQYQQQMAAYQQQLANPQYVPMQPMPPAQGYGQPAMYPPTQAAPMQMPAYQNSPQMGRMDYGHSNSNSPLLPRPAPPSASPVVTHQYSSSSTASTTSNMRSSPYGNF